MLLKNLLRTKKFIEESNSEQNISIYIKMFRLSLVLVYIFILLNSNSQAQQSKIDFLCNFFLI